VPEEGTILHGQNEQDRGDLEKSRHFAHETWLDFWRVIGKDHYQDAQENDDIPRDDNHSQPAGKDFDDSKGDESSREEEFIGNRIEIGSQFRALAGDPGYETIDPIRNPCNRKDDEGPTEGFINDKDDEEWNQQDSYESQNIGEVHIQTQ